MSLFEKVPDRIFSPLAASKRRFYAALLIHLYEHTFDSAGDTLRVTDLIAEIGDFIERYDAEHGPSGEDGDDLDGAVDARIRALAVRDAKGQDIRRYMAYHLLKDTGWLIELRDRYRKLVDLSPEGRILLRELHKIASGDTRSYGGVVLNVLGNLDQAKEHPDERSENIRNAWQFSRDFVQHLRTLSGRMRRVEDEILGHKELRHFFRAFFADYVTKYLISDWKTLHTKNNPFRFRSTILERVRQIEADALLIPRLAAGYVREGRAATERDAEEVIRRELSDVYWTFDNIDRHLEIIGETKGDYRLDIPARITRMIPALRNLGES